MEEFLRHSYGLQRALCRKCAFKYFPSNCAQIYLGYVPLALTANYVDVTVCRVAHLRDVFHVVVTSLIFILMFLELIPASPQLDIFCIKFLTLQEKLTTFGSSAFLYNSRVGLSRLEIAGKLIELDENI